MKQRLVLLGVLVSLAMGACSAWAGERRYTVNCQADHSMGNVGSTYPTGLLGANVDSQKQAQIQSEVRDFIHSIIHDSSYTFQGTLTVSDKPTVDNETFQEFSAALEGENKLIVGKTSIETKLPKQSLPVRFHKEDKNLSLLWTDKEALRAKPGAAPGNTLDGMIIIFNPANGVTSSALVEMLAFSNPYYKVLLRYRPKCQWKLE